MLNDNNFQLRPNLLNGNINDMFVHHDKMLCFCIHKLKIRHHMDRQYTKIHYLHILLYLIHFHTYDNINILYILFDPI